MISQKSKPIANWAVERALIVARVVGYEVSKSLFSAELSQYRAHSFCCRWAFVSAILSRHSQQGDLLLASVAYDVRTEVWQRQLVLRTPEIE